jgi:hypothetical protein
MTKGEKFQLKLEGLSFLFFIMFHLEKQDCPVLQTEASGFA